MKCSIEEKAIRVKAILFDVDGVLTDGKIHISENGEEYKSFNTLDGFAIKLLYKFGIKTGVISGRRSKALEHRLEELNITYNYLNTEHKLEALRDFMRSTGLKSEEIAYIGDDLPDLPVLNECGLSFAPRNGASDVISRVDQVTENPGGNGAAREAIELILKSQGLWSKHLESLS